MLATPRPPSLRRCPPIGHLPLVAALALLTGCDVGGGLRVEKAIRGTIDVPEGTTAVHIHVSTGGITVLPAEDGSRSVEYDLNTLRVGSDAQSFARLEKLDPRPMARPSDPGVLRIAPAEIPPDLVPPPESAQSDPRRRNAFVVKGVYRVPRGLSIVVETERGPVAVLDRRADVRARTDGGEIRLDQVVGRADLETENGVILVDGFRGSLNARTGRGDIFVWVRQLTEEGMSLQTRFGNVQAHVPPSLEFDLELRARRGEVTNGFGLPIQQPAEHEFGAKGKIGAGGTPVVVRTAHGNASIRPSATLGED